MTKTLTDIKGDDVLRLTSLDVENVLRLRAVHLTLDDDGALIVEGKNEQGKTSVIRSLEMLLAGGKSIADDPIHGDAKTGKIVGKFGDIVVTKTFSRTKAPALKITSPGAKYKTPQSILTALTTTIALDPLKFMGYDDAKKAKTISEMQGCDLSDAEARRKEAFEARRDANREEKRLRHVVESLPELPKGHDVTQEETSVGELLAELKAAQEHNKEGDALDEAVSKWTRSAADHRKTAEGLEDQISDLTAQLESARQAIKECENYASEQQAKLARFIPADEDEIQQKIDNIEEINKTVRLRKQRAQAIVEWEESVNAAGQLDETLREIDTEIETARAEAASRLPVEGLSISDGIVLYKGKPLSQAGDSAELRVSTAIAIALNKDKRVKLLCLDKAEQLDSDNTRLVLEMARDAGFQVIMARVGDGKEASVVIEDGVVKE
jgi:hypothetical protein